MQEVLKEEQNERGLEAGGGAGGGGAVAAFPKRQRLNLSSEYDYGGRGGLGGRTVRVRQARRDFVRYGAHAVLFWENYFPVGRWW